MAKKKAEKPVGDREQAFLDRIAATANNENPQQSDIPGFASRQSDTGEEEYLPEQAAVDELLQGYEAKGMTREEAIQMLARSEGIQMPGADPEELLQAIIEKRKQKQPPEYEPQVSRPGLK
jgi:hypothetical protein